MEIPGPLTAKKRLFDDCRPDSHVRHGLRHLQVPGQPSYSKEYFFLATSFWATIDLIRKIGEWLDDHGKTKSEFEKNRSIIYSVFPQLSANIGYRFQSPIIMEQGRMSCKLTSFLSNPAVWKTGGAVLKPGGAKMPTFCAFARTSWFFGKLDQASPYQGVKQLQGDHRKTSVKQLQATTRINYHIPKHWVWSVNVAWCLINVTCTCHYRYPIYPLTSNSTHPFSFLPRHTTSQGPSPTK